MKILMISPYLPWPLYGGAAVRSFNIIKELSQRGHQIFLVAGKNKNLKLSSSPLSQMCKRLYLYELPPQSRLFSIIGSLFSFQPYPQLQFKNKNFSQIVYNLLKNESFDLIWINCLFTADILLKIPIRDIPIILDQLEADELIWQRYLREGNFLEKIFSYLNLKKIQALQKKVFKYINVLLCVSDEEAQFMKTKVKKDLKIWVVPNGVDKDFFQPNKIFDNSEPIILMTGAMGIVRNIKAALWFAKKIFPKIKRIIPQAQFWIVGSSPDKKILALKAIAGVFVTGTVKEIKSYYNKAKVYVAPFKFGRGTRLKVLEAMAMGIPIVSTKSGCQGIEVVDNEHLLIRDNEVDFANGVIELLTNSQKRQDLATRARKLVEEKYSWKLIVDALELKLKQNV